MTDETPTLIPFHYIKSNDFRVLHVDGAMGNITPAGLIFVALYNERSAIPQMMVHEVTDVGQIGKEQPEGRVGKKGIVREVEVGAVMSVETAKAFIAWLQERIELVEKLRKNARQEEEKNASLH